ncbi:MAG: phosphohydrolase [Alistipes finegoldii]
MIRYLQFIREAERLKTSCAPPTPRKDGTKARPNTVAAGPAGRRADRRRPELDMQRVVLMCLIHDLGGLRRRRSGHCADRTRVKAASELAAMERLTTAPAGSGSHDTEYGRHEACQTPEARWVKASTRPKRSSSTIRAPIRRFDYAFNLTYGSEYFDDGRC